MNKRIIVQDYCGYPFPVQLSRKLAARGHEVLHLYAGHGPWPRGNMQVMDTDSPSFHVQGLFTRKPLERYAFAKRWFQEREYGRLVTNAAAAFRPDLVISADMPLDPQSILQAWCCRHETRFVFWLQDIISVATKSILSQKLAWPGHLVGNYYTALEKRLLRNSDHVIAITEDFGPFLAAAGVPPHRVTVIPNWMPLDDLPVLPKDNPWAQAQGLTDKFCFLYSGTLGLKHNPDLLVQLALHFKDDPNVKVLVGSEGVGADWLAKRKQALALDNLRIMGYQPLAQYPSVLATGDVMVAVLEPDAGAYSVPSKVLSYLAAKRALLLAVPEDNLAAQVVSTHRAGMVVDPADPDQLLAAAQKLRSDADLCQTFACNARHYAEQNFDIEKIADQFEAVL